MKAIRKLTYQTGRNFGWYPELRIAGAFIKDKYGWEPGDKVKVEYLKDKIVIKTGGKND